ncbi:MAG: TonB-dependent receptor, partial [Bryobacteraceae bacterium]
NLFVSSPLENNSEDQGVVKIDHQLDATDTLSAHYAVFNENDSQPFNQKFLFTNLPGFGSTALLRGQNASLEWSRDAGYRLTNQMRLGFNRRNNAFTQEGSGVNQAAQIGFPTVSSDPLNYGYPNIVLAGFDGIGTAIVLPQNLVANTFQWSDDAVWKPQFNGGRHQFRFGVDVRRIQENEFLNALSRGQYLFLGPFTGSPLGDLISGLPTVAVITNGDSHGAFRTTAASLYGLDTIRVNQNLSLTLGLRYEHNAPPVEIRDRVSTPDLSGNSLTCSPKPDCEFLIGGTNGVPRATYNGTAGDFGPRVGIAWRPFGSNAFVVRSAYGIFYDVSILNVNIFPHGNPPFYSVSTFANRGTSTIQTILNPAFSLPQPPSATMVTPNFRDAYLQQWHFTVDHEMGKNAVLSAGYVGSKGTNLLDQRQGNQAPAGGVVPYPQFGTIRLLASDGSSTYHSMQLSLEKRFVSSFGLLAAYTWSRSIDNVSALFGSSGDPGFPQNSSDLRSERGLSDFHAEHRFVLSGFYDLPARPFGAGSGFAAAGNRLFGGWNASAISTLQTGRPFTVNRGIDQSKTGVTLGMFDRPDLIGDPMKAGPVSANPNPACHLTRAQGGLAADVPGDVSSWFNPCAFAAPSTVRFGTAGRNILLGPGLANVDLALRRDVRISEGQRIQASFEFFNLLNHPNFDLPNGNFDSKAVGVVQSADAFGNKPPRQIQIGLRYEF